MVVSAGPAGNCRACFFVGYGSASRKVTSFENAAHRLWSKSQSLLHVDVDLIDVNFDTILPDSIVSIDVVRPVLDGGAYESQVSCSIYGSRLRGSHADVCICCRRGVGARLR